MFTMEQAVEELIAQGRIDKEWFEHNRFEMNGNGKTG
jgi:hypothetical protein